MSSTAIPYDTTLSPTKPTGGRVRAVAGACAGNLVEWYDFFVYAYTAIYFSSSFFPAGDPASQLLASAGVLAVGYFMRPLGGWLFGWIADTRGRKVSMILSVFMMCAGSLMIAALPTYETIGFAAPVLLLVARLVQGLSIGGEYGAGATYLSEIATKGRRGFFSSFQYATLIAGQLVALMVLLVLQSLLPVAELKAWGWRVPFLIGALLAIVVVVLRRTMQETASEEAMHRKEAGSLAGLWQHKRAVALVVAFTMGGSLYFYVFTSYMQKLLINTARLDATTTSVIMTAALALFMLLQPLFGMLADRVGIKTNMLLFTGLATLAVVPLLSTLATVSNPVVAFALVMTALVIAAFYTPIAGIVKADLFPPEVRCLGVGFPYAVANALFGGTAEFIALSFKQAGSESHFSYYVAAVVSVSFLGAVLMPDLRTRGYLDGTGAIERAR
ncbi:MULTISPECIES: MFS family transporter [Methylobacterium]|uniref:MFS family transporter n=1 Tax=Methylobacterium TaxID=407 RepID=UPI0013EE3015|nr:MFS family transporter [Methylobacterium sp. DB0501]NGM37456.1 MFS transporter [Methylobacterium sp. DB0501]